MTRLTQTTAGRRVALLILSGAFVATATILVAYNAFAPVGSVELAVGQVATADIIAPHSITYDSEMLTSQARQSAADAIREIYDPPNPAVARQQSQLARHVLDYMDNVRHDSFATPVQQKADLTAISAIPVDVELAAQILTLSADAWKDVDSEVMTTLDTVMRNPVREDGLPEIYASLPNVVGLTVDEARTDLITGLVKSFIKPNTFYNDERTKEARKQAAATVPTEQRSFAQGQIVVRGGSIVTEADMEALTQLKLVNAPDRRLQMFSGALLFVVILGALGALYLRQLHIALFYNLSVMILIGAMFLVFLAGARILETGADFQSHIYPAAAFSLIVVVLAGPEAAIVLTAALAATIGLITGNSLEFALLAAFGGSAGVLSLYRIERLNAYFRAGLVIGVVNVGIGLLSVLLQGNVDPARVVVFILAGVLNGIFCAGLAIVGLYLVSSVLNMPTSVRLIELSQPNQPLL
ncbi:MAG TPA: hypothetical protein VKQ72_06100, partial [Aggregatilineales bacterium]|nr:hypothetical protein [Aggregatilineales bacterium]